MRRTVVPLSLLVAAAGIWILGMASSAPAARRMPRIICAVQSPHIVPCCPVPLGPARGSHDLQPICCQPNMCCASGITTQATCCPSAGCCTPSCTAGSLTISSSPNPSTAGKKVVVSGGLVGNPVSGATVVLWRELAGQSSFHQVSQTTTDSAGRYTFTLRPGTVMADQAWYVTSNAVKSATVHQLVAALVGLSSSTHAVAVGNPLVLRGHVTPSHAGQTVLVEQSRGGAWHVIVRARLGNGSNYAVSHSFPHAGAVELRTVLRGDKRNGTSVSRALTVTVKH